MAKAKTYYEKLKDPRWQKKRLEVMGRDNFMCQECGDTENTLNVHHGYYTSGKDPWEYPIDSLHTVCENCHEKFEEVKHDVHREISRMGISELKKVLIYALERNSTIHNPTKEELDKMYQWMDKVKPDEENVYIYILCNWGDIPKDVEKNIYKYHKQLINGKTTF